MKKIAKEKIQTWFVTGASSGVGHEMSKQLLERGYNVIAVARRVPDFDSPNALCLSCDVTKPETIKEAVQKGIEKFGKIDVLVNNAGNSHSVLLEDETIDHLKDVFELNYYGVFNTIHELIPHFRENKNGTVINNTSMHGISIRAYGTAYCSTKHAVEAMTAVLWHEANSFCRAMAFELGFYGETDIKKNAVGVKNTKEEYKGLALFYKPFNYRRYKNNLKETISVIIDTTELETMPRHLICGQDAVFKAQTEVEVLQEDIKFAEKYLSRFSTEIKTPKKQKKYKYTLKYYTYKILKNFVFGNMRKKLKAKQNKYKTLKE